MKQHYDTLDEPLYEYVERSPLEIDAYRLSNGQSLALKHETEHTAGSFKQRGMVGAMLVHDSDNVVLASAGGAAVAAAYAASRLGRHVDIFAPESIPPGKVALIHQLGGRAARLTTVAGGFPEAQAAAVAYAKREGATYQSPFDDLAVIAAHGTVAREVIEKTDEPRHFFVPVGGGSILAGTLEATADTGDYVTAVQFDTNTSAEQSVSRGEHTTATRLNALAEGSAANIGHHTLEIIMKHQDRLDFVTVSPADVGAAIAEEYDRRYWQYEVSYPGSNVEPEYNMPETTGFLAEAGAAKYATTHHANDELWVAVRTGANRDEAREQALLDAYRFAQDSHAAHTRVWQGVQLRQ